MFLCLCNWVGLLVPDDLGYLYRVQFDLSDICVFQKSGLTLILLAATTVPLTSGLFSDLWHLNLIHPLDIIKYGDWTGFSIRRDWVPRSCYGGQSPQVRAGDFVHQHYVGRLANGTRFDSRYYSYVLKYNVTCLKLNHGDLGNHCNVFIANYKSAQIQKSHQRNYHYFASNWFYDVGFVSSYERNETFNFFLDTGKVITGVDIGMKGMCKWERRDITVPPQLGYGQRQVGTYKSIF